MSLAFAKVGVLTWFISKADRIKIIKIIKII